MAIGSESSEGGADEAAEHSRRQAPGTMTATATRTIGPTSPPRTTAAIAVTVASVRLGERVESVEGARAGASDERRGRPGARSGESVRRSPSATHRRRRPRYPRPRAAAHPAGSGPWCGAPWRSG